MKKILIINGHPDSKSFNHALAERYAKGARAGGHEVKLIHLGELRFDPVLRFGYRTRMKVEKDLEPQQGYIKWCNHFVIVTPIWWLARTSLLQGYFERVLMPGFAYNHRKGLFDFYPIRRLKGRSARVIYTQDGPRWVYSLILRGAFWVSLKRGVLWYCGFGPIRRTCLRNVGGSSKRQREGWLRRVERLGRHGK